LIPSAAASCVKQSQEIIAHMAMIIRMGLRITPTSPSPVANPDDGISRQPERNNNPPNSVERATFKLIKGPYWAAGQPPPSSLSFAGPGSRHDAQILVAIMGALTNYLPPRARLSRMRGQQHRERNVPVAESTPARAH
jgi:hypothetical protein